MSAADLFFALLYAYLTLVCIKHSVVAIGPTRSIAFVTGLFVIPSAAFIHLRGHWNLAPDGPLNSPDLPWMVRLANNSGGEPNHVNVVVAVLAISLIYTVATLLVAVFTQLYDKRGSRVHPVYKPFIKWGIVITGVLFYLGLSGISLSGLFIGMGAASLVAGFALQETLANLITGVSLEIEGIVRPGNWIEPESGPAGRVLSKGLRATTIRTLLDETVVIPNKTLAGARLTAYGVARHPFGRTLDVTAAYGEAPLRVKEILRQILLDEPRILGEPEPRVFVTAFGDSSITYRMMFWLEEFECHEAVEDELLTRVWYAFGADRVEIPFPVRQVFLHTAAEVRSAGAARESAHAELAEFLGGIAPLRAHLGRAELMFLASNATERGHLPGEKVVNKGESGDSVYFVREGFCEVRLPSGEMKALGEGEFFGEMALFNRGLRTADVRAGAKGARVARIGREPLLAIFRSHPDLRTAFALSHETRAVESGFTPHNAGMHHLSFSQKVYHVLRRWLIPW